MRLNDLSRGQKMSAKAFVQDTRKIANAGDERLDELEQELESRSEALPAACAFVRRSCTFIREAINRKIKNSS